MNFFEYVQTASMERLHSAVLCWIFSSDNTTFTDRDKTEIVDELFMTKGASIGKIERTDTEYDHMDLIICGTNDVVVVENKIKAGEHSDQLERYLHAAKKHFPNKSCHYVFLTLIDDQPSHCAWKPVKYTSVLKSLKLHAEKSEGPSEILTSYIEALGDLTESFCAFLKAPRRYPNVFNDSNRKRHAKPKDDANSDAIRAYISNNGLETVLQRAYYQKILSEIPRNALRLVVTETRGNGLLDIKQPGAAPKIEMEGRRFGIGIQFQSGRVKLQIEAEMDEKGRPIRPDRIIEDKKIINRQQEHVARFIRESYPDENWKLNTAKSDGSAYFSLSRPIQWKNESKYYDQKWPDVFAAYAGEISHCIEMAQRIRDNYEQ